MSADAIGIVSCFAVIVYLATHLVMNELRQEGQATRQKLQEISNRLERVGTGLEGVIHYTKVLNDKVRYPPGQSPLD